MKTSLSRSLGEKATQWITALIAVVLILVILVVFLIVRLSNNIIIIERSPFSTYETIRISKFTADRNFREVWGLSTAKLLGNSIPRESQRILAVLSSMATSEVFTSMKYELKERFEKMQGSGVEIYWRPEGRIIHHSDEELVEIQGYRTIRNTITGDEDIRPYVYKFKITAFDYGPYITEYIHGYTEGLVK